MLFVHSDWLTQVEGVVLKNPLCDTGREVKHEILKHQRNSSVKLYQCEEIAKVIFGALAFVRTMIS